MLEHSYHRVTAFIIFLIKTSFYRSTVGPFEPYKPFEQLKEIGSHPEIALQLIDCIACSIKS